MTQRKKDTRDRRLVALTDRFKVAYNSLLAVYEESKKAPPNGAKMLDDLNRFDMELARARMDLETLREAAKA